MGVPLSLASQFIRAAKSHAWAGRIIQLGRQDIQFGWNALISLLQNENHGGIPVNGEAWPEDHLIWKAMKSPEPYRGVAPDGAPAVSDNVFFSAVGFHTVHSVDVSDFEGATYCYDFNESAVRTVVPEAYDVVYDGGTVEHVFHTPNFFKLIFDLTAVGGCVIHHTPGNNYFNHGFYQISPTLFYDYYTANGWEILDANVYFQNLDLKVDGFHAGMRYQGDSMRSMLVGGEGSRSVLEFVCRKTAASTWDKIPLQGHYQVKHAEA